MLEGQSLERALALPAKQWGLVANQKTDPSSSGCKGLLQLAGSFYWKVFGRDQAGMQVDRFLEKNQTSQGREKNSSLEFSRRTSQKAILLHYQLENDEGYLHATKCSN